MGDALQAGKPMARVKKLGPARGRGESFPSRRGVCPKMIRPPNSSRTSKWRALHKGMKVVFEETANQRRSRTGGGLNDYLKAILSASDKTRA